MCLASMSKGDVTLVAVQPPRITITWLLHGCMPDLLALTDALHAWSYGVTALERQNSLLAKQLLTILLALHPLLQFPAIRSYLPTIIIIIII
jgi:hypothetical protein